MVFFSAYLILVLAIEPLYHDPLIKWATTDGGIQRVQDRTGETQRELWKLWTELGGGYELLFVAALGFIFGRRSTFIYYIWFIGLDKIFVAYFKLAMANPRPYMIDASIQPLKCSTSFGCPSGHATAASFSSVVVFLDVFHGETHGLVKQRYFNWPTYIVALLAAIFWMVSIPYSRLVLGVHSPNQVLFGSSLGIWSALFLHFVVRDRLIIHIEKVQGTLEVSRNHPSILPSQVQPETEDTQSNSKNFSAEQQVISLLVFYISYECLAVLTFHYINQFITPTSANFLMWSKNFTEGGCGVIDLQFSLQNKGLNDCAYLTRPFMIYIFSVYRDKVIPFQKIKGTIKT